MIGTQIQTMITGNMDMLTLGGMFILICLSALQCVKAGSTSRQLKFLTKKLSGYLQAVLEDSEETEELTEPPVTVSRQEQNMRERIELQKQQKKEREAQLFDAVLSDIFP